MFNPTFNNISAMLWQSVLLVEETRVPGSYQTTIFRHNVTARSCEYNSSETVQQNVFM